MNRMDDYLKRHPDRKHFIPFITAGDPNPEATIDLALMLQELGANVLELGIPYSDPLADGPVIQRASIRALAGGMTLKKAMALVPLMRENGLKIPVIIFTYYNPLLQLNERKFIETAPSYGIDGLLIPDLPFEESAGVREACREVGLKLISLVAPTTSPQRLKMIAEAAEGFLYCVSSLGVTGERSRFHADVFAFLARVGAVSAVPIEVGFGVSNAEQIDRLKDHCDGFVAGSAIIKEIEAQAVELARPDTRPQAIQKIKSRLSEKLLTSGKGRAVHERTIETHRTL
ncbi:tryptophan synthase subunit alpha [Camelliibacillus cellulosilyticus]|uniref:Tryptophan synthase alpha chain n=1 Tax=Camelliibacillus cellulosilyticus TaxID=2174486 RepID=A0ABV9GHN3_9BACL